MSYRPIWHADGGDFVLLRCHLSLSEPCRGGHLRVTASGPLQLFLDGVRVAGAPGGAATERPLWHPVSLTGAWDTGVHELLAVVGPSPAGGDRWFACDGHLDVVVPNAAAQPVESGLHWQALALPSMTAPDIDERYSALADTRHLDDAWAGVVSVAADPVGEAAATEERLIEAPRFAAFAEVSASAPLSFSPDAVAPSRCKSVHREGILAGPAPAATILTPDERGIVFVLDLGRQVSGHPVLRLREGRGGVVDIGLATTWGRIDRVLRYVCGSGRQEWYGLTPSRCRYLVVRLAHFTEEVLLERLAMVERYVPASADAVSLNVSQAADLAWAAGTAALQGSRLDAYYTTPPPRRCDWLATLALLLNDAVRTGHMTTARTTLLGRAPDAETGARDPGFALCLEAYHLYSGDADTAAALLPAALATVGRTAGADGVALAAADADAAGRLCTRLGRPQEGERCAMQAGAARQQLQAFWRPEQGLYADNTEGTFSQRTNALALLAAASGDQIGQITRGLRAAGVTAVRDLTEAFLLAHALWQAGQGARAMAVIETRWLRIVEREGPAWRDKRGAEAMGAAPGPDFLLGRYLLGVAPVEPGFTRRRVQPELSICRRAQGRLQTPAGALTVAWRTRVDEETPLRTTVQLGADGEGTTELALDRGGRRNPTLSVNGEVVWRNEKIYPNPNVHEVAAEAESVVLVFEGAGAWEITLE